MEEIINSAVFGERYAQLNQEQKKAVDTIYGPVMVMAGPGTGKTEVLAMRIANLLRSEAQVKPHEILCLTFTDEATVAMRKRLLQIVGDQAHKINIYTFHAFCNNIIQSYMEYFGVRDLMPVSDLERMDLVYDMIENLETGHPLRRLKGDIFYDAKNLIALFGIMKSEDWSAEHISGAIDFYLDALPQKEGFYYKRANSKKGIEKGDPHKEKIKEETDKMERTRAAAFLFPLYQEKMEQRGWYDFNDMILWVLKAFKEHPELLQIQQERFQFILVDEFQDTSGAQNELLNLLAAYWEDPNLFIVGDDDQSIFEFQGARLKNIIDFYLKYENNIQIILLKQNYRSSQNILSPATTSINHNKQRLIAALKQLDLDKNIIAANPRFLESNNPDPVIAVYNNVTQEEIAIVQAIESIQKQGVDLQNVAVLYAQHKQADNIIALLERKKIPYWVKRPVNILELPLIQQILHIFRYLQAETVKPFSGEEWIFLLLHNRFFHITPIDIASLSLYLQTKESKHKRWRYLLQDDLLIETLGLKNPSAIYSPGKMLEKWLTEMQKLTLPMLLQKIYYEGGIVADVMKGAQPIWEMQVLQSFFEFVKEECAKQPRMTIRDLLELTDRMENEHIALPIQKTIQRENGVRFYTAFSAKGHEFEHVFIIGATKNFWESKRGNNRGFSLPDNLTTTSQEEETVNNNEEIARRLFYVAMTRAKKHLHISYSEKDIKGKILEPTMFISEIDPRKKEITVLDEMNLLQEIGLFLTPADPPSIELAKKELLKRRLENFTLSVSAMNKYLRCPLGFYYEYVLRVPEAKSDALAFGISIHYALEQLFKKMLKDEQKIYPSREETIRFFEYSMKREEGSFTAIQYERRLEMGREILNDYYEHYIGDFNKKVLPEFTIPAVVIDGIPAKGKLDKIEFNGKECTVIDYKTGNPDKAVKKELLGPSEANPLGADYWRQMVFYKLLLENYPPAYGWNMTAGVFDFIEKDKMEEYIRFTVPIQNHDLIAVKQQIKEVYTKIMNHEFDKGCNDEKCRWCNFAKNYQLSEPVAEEQDT